ncbi:MAG TPA: glycosyltransferase [bacterium]
MDSSRPRILIAYATAGAGHRRAAEALADAARRRWPDADVRCLDALAWTPGWYRSGYARLYLFLVRALPMCWKFSYRALDQAAVFRCIQPFRRAWNRLIGYRMPAVLLAEQPDVAVLTHFFPADLLGAARTAGRLRAPVVVVVTDWHPHRLWLGARPDAVVVANQAGADRCVELGVPRERVAALGIPTVAAAPLTETRRRALRESLGLAHDRLTVLVTSGGTTVGRFADLVERLLRLEAMVPGRLQLIVVCGDDARTTARLEAAAAAAPMPARVFGFVHNMLDLMGTADLAVAKAGGLTVAEALACELPLVFYHAIPGQEESNARYVARQGAGVIALGPEAAAEFVRHCASSPELMAKLRTGARDAGRPNAANDIIEQVVEPLLTPRNV